jgi:hypothetical protein
MAIVAGLIASVILALIGVVHVYWATGGQLGFDVALPVENGKPIFHPTRFATFIVAIGLFSMASIIIVKNSAILPTQIEKAATIGLWLMVLVFLARAIGDFRYAGFFKRVRAGRFAWNDTFLYSPLCLLLAILIAVAARF